MALLGREILISQELQDTLQMVGFTDTTKADCDGKIFFYNRT
jgi:hypothetical protein